MRNIMAIDASTKSSGVAIYQDNKLVHFERILNTDKDSYKRIKYMWEHIEKLYNKYDIKEVVMEDILPEDVKHNQAVFKALMYLQSWIVLHFHDYQQKVILVSANEWRRKCGITIGRYGTRANVKQQSIDLVKDKYGFSANDDICDAICIGWSYINGGANTTVTPHRNNNAIIIEEKGAF